LVLQQATLSPSETIAFSRNCMVAFPAYWSTAAEPSLGLRDGSILLRSKVIYES
jgi:hypothetical protein